MIGKFITTLQLMHQNLSRNSWQNMEYLFLAKLQQASYSPDTAHVFSDFFFVWIFCYFLGLKFSLKEKDLRKEKVTKEMRQEE